MNTSGWVDGKGYQLVIDLANIFKIDVILCLNTDLYNYLKEDKQLQNTSVNLSVHISIPPVFLWPRKFFQHSTPIKRKEKWKMNQVAKLAKSDGVQIRDSNLRRKLRMQAIHEYFYGHLRGSSGFVLTQFSLFVFLFSHLPSHSRWKPLSMPSGPKKTLCPHPQVFPFHTLRIFRCGGGPKAPSTALPIGQERLLDPNKLVEVDPTLDTSLLNNILAVSYSSSEEKVCINTRVRAHIFTLSIVLLFHLQASLHTEMITVRFLQNSTLSRILCEADVGWKCCWLHSRDCSRRGESHFYLLDPYAGSYPPTIFADRYINAIPRISIQSKWQSHGYHHLGTLKWFDWFRGFGTETCLMEEKARKVR